MNDPIENGWLYQVQIDEGSDFSSPIADEICSEPNIILGIWLEDKTYYWRVRRLDQSDTVSQWTSTASFTVTPDITPPTVSEIKPADGAEVTEGLPIISVCVVDNQTAIDPNSIIMTIDSEIIDSQLNVLGGLIFYESGWPLVAGEHTVNLAVADIHGNETNTSWSFTIERCINLEAKPFRGGMTNPTNIIHVVDSNAVLLECEPYSGYKFLKWSIEPADSGVIELPYSLATTVNLLGNATVVANFTSVGDFTDNGKVGFEDFSVFGNYWQKDDCSTPLWCNGTDLTQDGVVNIEDLTLFSNEWLYDSSLDILNLIDFSNFANWWGVVTCEQQNDCNGADFNLDGYVDFDDLIILSDNWLK